MNRFVTKAEQLVERIARGLAGFVTNNPWKALLLSFVLLAASIPGLQGLTPDPTHRAYFKASDALRIQVEEMERRFSNDDSVVLMVHSPSGVFDAETSELLVRLTEEMWRVPDIIRVESLSNYRWVRASGDDIVVEPLIPDHGPYTDAVLAERKSVALNHEIIPGYLVSEDAKTALVIGFVRPDDKGSAAAPGPIVNGVREMISRHQGSDHEFHITGRTAVMQSFLEATEHDMKSFMPFLLIIVVVMLWLNFRRLGAFTPLIVVIFSVIATMGISGWLGMKVTNITAVVPQFLIAIGIANAIHILNSYFALIRKGEDRRDAMYQALSENFMPTVMTSVTTAIGFLSFVTSDIIAIGQLGVMVGIGVEVAWVLTYLLLPPVVLLLPSFKRGGKRAHNQPAVQTAGELDAIHAPRLDRYVAALSKFRLPVVAVFLAIAAVSVYLASDIRVNANPFKYFAEGFWLRTANDFAERHLNGAQGMEVLIETGLEDGIKDPAFLSKVEQFQQWIDRQHGVVKTMSVLDILKQTNRSVHGDEQAFYALPNIRDEVSQLLFLYSLNLPQGLDLSNRVTARNDALRISVKWTLYDSADATGAAKMIAEKGRSMGLNVSTTGKVLLFQNMNQYVVKSFFTSFGSSLLLISLLMMAGFMSVRLGLLSLVPNIVPMFIGGAILKFLGHPFDIGAVVVASVCIGIAVDDTIHFMSHFKRCIDKGCSPEEAVKRTFHEVFPAVWAITVILVSAFGLFAFADFVPNQNFGILTAGILTFALIAEATMTPALLLLVFKRKRIPAGQREVGQREVVASEAPYGMFSVRAHGPAGEPAIRPVEAESVDR